SINPQTMSDEVLRAIGRKHTAAQVYDAMNMARAAGFDSNNMDMIAGLPGDTPQGFSRSLNEVLSMHPENITVHTLSMKRASHLVTGMAGEGIPKPSGDIKAVGEMLDRCTSVLPSEGYHPYYLYRQTRMLGNLENVGWSKPGHDGLYNIYIMDETHTILAVGAGGVTKLRQPRVNNIERVYNFKFPYEYISRFDEIIERKKGVTHFYEEFC
ncbi:MAG: radical SAM protein, partial [Clostridia bacterium]|nr:radical SAM protein [Clostridia bacterium]